jgi:hypothetical protein
MRPFFACHFFLIDPKISDRAGFFYCRCVRVLAFLFPKEFSYFNGKRQAKSVTMRNTQLYYISLPESKI